MPRAPRVLAFLLMFTLARAVDPAVVPLWPEGVPDAKADGGAEQGTEDHSSNVHVPTLTYFPAPADRAAGTAVIVCPGGGYEYVSFVKEGTEIAAWLNARGVSAFVLKYRLREYGQPAPLRDVLRAVRLVRSRAGEFGLDPHKIGLIGFSAGGHLAASAATLFDHSAGRTGAALDAVSARPDAVALLYPVILMEGPHIHAGSRRALLGEHPSPETVQLWSPDRQVTAATPPVFIVHTEEDGTVPVENALEMYAALRRAQVPAEMHLYAKGHHGIGLRLTLPPTASWPDRYADWLKSLGWIR